MKSTRRNYEIGDIVFVSEYKYEKLQTDGQNHLFVIIDEEKVEAVPAEYFGLIVSSHKDKCKDNSRYIYNEPLNKNNNNGLRCDSIVKCDQVFSIPPQNIQFKIGSVDVDDYIRFINSYAKSVEDSEETAKN